MTFAQRLKEKRTSAQLSQQALADKVGITSRSIQNYENGNRYPNSLAIAVKIAEALQTTSEYLLAEEGPHIFDAAEKGGAKAKRDVKALVEEVTGLFAGGELAEEDKDAVMQAVTEAYWIAKKKNKKYASH
jgi:Helix-turn-helix.